MALIVKQSSTLKRHENDNMRKDDWEMIIA